MKYKYKFVSNYYVYEDDLLEEFRQMSLKGYSLKEVGYFFYKFERDDHIYILMSELIVYYYLIIMEYLYR